MKVFIVATPLFDRDMAVQAYRLRDQSGDKALSVKNDFRGRGEAFLSPGLDLIEKISPEPFTGGLPLFAEISRFQLMTGAPVNNGIAPESLICLLPGSLPNDADLLDRCRALKAAGYTLALDNFPLSGVQSPYFEFVSYLWLDCKNSRFHEVCRAVQARLRHIKIIFDNVPDRETFDLMGRDRDNRGSLFSGQFYSLPITKGVRDVSPLKVNAMQLLRTVNEDDFELSDIAEVVGRDPALSISLLRFINSGALGLTHKVESIQSAVSILGQQEVRRWATVAISVSLGQDRPGEITRLSLVRAKFAENLAGPFELGVFQPSLFMAGLFSLLDVILQMPMAQAVEEVAVNARVREALVEHTGDIYKVLRFIFAYERADWDMVSIMMIQNNLSIDAISGAFINALVWYNQLLNSLSEEEAGLEGEEV